MKLRISGNFLRLRLTEKEVAAVGAGAAIEEIVEFGADESERLIYALVPADDEETVTAVYDAKRISVLIPRVIGAQWAQTSQIGIEAEKIIGDNRVLRILIEKDFA